MKKILQISKYYYPYIGGVEQVARDVTNALAKEDVEQKIICFNEDVKDDSGNLICNRKKTCIDNVDGIEVIRCGYQIKIASQSISIPYIKQLKKMFKEFNPDIVIFHYPNPFVASIMLHYIPKTAHLFLYWHLDIVKQKILKKFFGIQNKKLIKRAEKVIGTSDKYLAESEYADYFKEKAEAIPLKVDEARVLITEKERKESDKIRQKYKDKIICFFVGRHVAYKGLQYLIDASRYLKSNIVVLIAGSGELTKDLKEQSKDDDKIHFLGRITDSELRMYMNACDIYCFPSITKNEAFGISLAEGMRFGKPAVTFTIPGSGVNFVSVSGETGIEVPNGNAKAYAEAIQKLAEDKELRDKLGKNAAQRAEKLFGEERFNKDVKRVICGEGKKECKGNMFNGYKRSLDKTKIPVCTILGVNIAAINMSWLVEYIKNNIKELKGDYICVSNVHTTVTAYKNIEYKYIQNSGIMSIPDGGPLSSVGHKRGYLEMSRTTGPSFMEKIFSISVENGWKHYFYGSTDDNLEEIKRVLSEKYPGIHIVGMYSPPFRPITEQENREIIKNINDSNADFVWVGLGAPKQEIWMAQHQGKISALMVGVGAGFDYISGRLKRAPKWMQDNNLEWFYRLKQEPFRLFNRYWNTNWKFIWLAYIRGK